MLKAYRDEAGDWDRYTVQFEQLLDERGIPHTLERADFEDGPCCLLCSEATPEHCHRRLVAERLATAWHGVEVVHL
jgi:hypothetical protein